MVGVVSRVERTIFIFIELVDPELTVFVVLDGVEVERRHVFHECRGIEVDISGVEGKFIVEKDSAFRWMPEKQGFHGVIEERDIEIIRCIIGLFLDLGHDELMSVIDEVFAFICV